MSDLFNADAEAPADEKAPVTEIPAAGPEVATVAEETTVEIETADEAKPGQEIVAVSGSPSAEPMVIEALVPAVVFAPGGVKTVVDKLREEVMAVPRDISTLKGRTAIKSLAYKVARSKTALDEIGKELNAKLKAQTTAVDIERRIMRDAMDELKTDVTRELDKWEDDEKERIQKLEDALVDISSRAVFLSEPSTQDIRDRIDQLDTIPDQDWREFIQRAFEAKKSARAVLTTLLAEAEAREAVEAENARIAAEQEAERVAEEQRKREEREAEIAQAAAAEATRLAEEAAEVERMRVDYLRSMIQHIVDVGNGIIGDKTYPYAILFRELEEKVVIDDSYGEFKEEAIKARGVALEKLRAGMKRQEEAAKEEERREAARLEAIEIAEKAAADRKRIEDEAKLAADQAKEVEARLEREKQKLIDDAAAAERKRIADIEAAEAQAESASRQALVDQEAAVAADRLKQKELADEADRVGRELATKRATDEAHTRTINGEVKTDLMAAGLSEADAVKAVIAIAKSCVRHTTIAY